MEEIAHRAGVSRATLYTYAKSKQDVVVRALAEEQLEQRRPAPDATTDPRTRLRALLVEWIVSFERMPLLSLVVKGDPELLRSLEQRPDVLQAFAGVDERSLLRDAILAAFPDCSSDKAESVISALQVLRSAGPRLVEEAPRYGLSPAQLAELLASGLVDGIG